MTSCEGSPRRVRRAFEVRVVGRGYSDVSERTPGSLNDVSALDMKPPLVYVVWALLGVRISELSTILAKLSIVVDVS